jgi:hypothetical protein
VQDYGKKDDVMNCAFVEAQYEGDSAWFLARGMRQRICGPTGGRWRWWKRHCIVSSRAYEAPERVGEGRGVEEIVG